MFIILSGQNSKFIFLSGVTIFSYQENVDCGTII